ncbi:MAG: zinc ribbon domain-containing protein [Promethearchaeota archaeon]
MSDNYPKLNSHSNKRFVEIISEGLYLFRKNWLTLIVPLGLIFIVSLIIKNLLVVDLQWQMVSITPAYNLIIAKDPSLWTPEESNLWFEYLTLSSSSQFITEFVTTTFNVVAMCLVSNYLYNKFIGNEKKLITELKKALKGRMLLVILLLGVGISVGSFLLYIPSTIIFGFYIFYLFTYHSNDAEHPIKEARDVARGAFWKIIGIFIVNYMIVLVFDFVYLLIIDFFVTPNYISWYNPVTRNYGLLILFDFVYYIVPFLFTPLFICLLTSLFVTLKARKEQNIQYHTSYQETPRSYGTPGIEKASSSGMYCPFCGKYVKEKIEYCPHCGKNLDFKLE